MNVNKIMLAGKVSKVKILETSSGKPMVSFTMTTFKNKKDGQSFPQYHPCIAYDGKADLILQYADGKNIYIEGSLDYHKEGEQWKPQVVVSNIQFLDNSGSAA